MSDQTQTAGAPRPRSLDECRVELQSKRDRLIAHIKAANAGPRGGGLSRGVQLASPAAGAAWIAGRMDADYMLPQLRPLYLELRILHNLDVPPWPGEPQTDADALQMLDDYLAACDRDKQNLPPAEPPGGWSEAKSPKQWARDFGVSVDTIKRRFKDGAITAKPLSTKLYRVAVKDLPADKKRPAK
jgi:hypothetical protein